MNAPEARADPLVPARESGSSGPAANPPLRPVLPRARSIYLPPAAERATWLVLGSLILVMGIELLRARLATPAPARGDPRLCVDLNRSPAWILAVLPGIGPRRAEAIIRHRESHGGFGRPEDLLAVPGIGPATLERLRPVLEAATSRPPVPAPRRRPERTLDPMSRSRRAPPDRENSLPVPSPSRPESE